VQSLFGGEFSGIHWSKIKYDSYYESKSRIRSQIIFSTNFISHIS
jgi:hypothetical protein